MDALIMHLNSSEPVQRWISFSVEDLNECMGADVDDRGRLRLYGALDRYRSISSLPPAPPHAAVQKRLDLLDESPARYARILKVGSGEISSCERESRAFRKRKDNVNHFVVGLLEAAGWAFEAEPTPAQLQSARESAIYLAQASRPGGEGTSGRSIDLALTDLVAAILRAYEDAGGTAAAWRWDEISGMYEGYLFDSVNYLLSCSSLVDHLAAFHGARRPEHRDVATWDDFRRIAGLPETFVSQESLRRYLRQARRLPSSP